MVHVPAVRAVMVAPLVPLAEQTPGVVDVKVTASPDVAVALAVVVPFTASVDGVNVIAPMVWLAAPTVMLLVTWGAAL